ncbi:MAG: MFS transporter [Novosphingobium sp.]|uniref:MFS transporter n=1 Tax=Novosphingobium sp. TaxID=1874826 RepID=UPI00301773B8
MNTHSGQPVYRKLRLRLIPLLFLGYVVAFLDRVNIGFAKLQMAGDLGFSDAVFGLGAGLFFIGYCLFEVPSNMVLARVGARRWMARIMLSWGLLSALFMFVGTFRSGGAAQALGLTDAAFGFYLLRFLLGAAEAGFYPGIILYLTYWFPRGQQARVIALFMMAVGASNVLGGPLSGSILQFADGLGGWRGWQWLFLIEAVPSIIVGIAFLLFLTDNLATARWLNDTERGAILQDMARDEAEPGANVPLGTAFSVFSSLRIWCLGLAYMSGTIALYAVTFWMPTLIQQFGIDKGAYLWIGLLTMIPWGVMAICQVLWAWHSDWTGERRWHSFLGYMLAATGLLCLALFSWHEVASIVALTMITTGLGFSIVTFWPLAHRYLAGPAAVSGIAFINSFGGLGGYCGPALIGWIGVGHMHGGMSFLPLAAIALVGGLIQLAVTADDRS